MFMTLLDIVAMPLCIRKNGQNLECASFRALYNVTLLLNRASKLHAAIENNALHAHLQLICMDIQ